MSDDLTSADYITITIGHAGGLTNENLAKAVAVTMLAFASPVPAVSIAVGGYDDDDRELFEIKEARLYIMRYAVAVSRLGIPVDRFFEDTQNLFQLCLAAEEGEPIKIIDGNFDVNAAMLRHKAKVRTKVN